MPIFPKRCANGGVIPLVVGEPKSAPGVKVAGLPAHKTTPGSF
jgi:hypothetical protein